MAAWTKNVAPTPSQECAYRYRELASFSSPFSTVAWWGPIVMNTRDELQRAIEELRAGTFLKNP
jgi:hypothetical protein